MADSASKESRTSAYRLLRYAILDTEGIQLFHELGLDWCLVRYVFEGRLQSSGVVLMNDAVSRTLARDNKHHLEKEQAVLLIRTMANVSNSISERHTGAGCGSVPISEAVIRAVIAIAEQMEDPFKGICLVTLAEIRKRVLFVILMHLVIEWLASFLVLVDVELMYRTGGIRCLIQAISDGPVELAPLFVSAFLYIIDAPRTRVYLRADVDLEVWILVMIISQARSSFLVECSLRHYGCLRKRRRSHRKDQVMW